MDNKDDKKNIHFNPEFIAKRAETQINSRVHVNPAFFQKSRPPDSVTRSYGISGTLNNSLPNSIIVQCPSSAPMTRQSQLVKTQTFPITTAHVQSNYGRVHNESYKAAAPVANYKQGNYRPVPKVSHSRIQNPVNSYSSLYSKKGGIYTSQSQESYASKTHPSTIWKTPNPTPLNYSHSAAASNTPRNTTKWLNTAGSLSSSRFRYQCQDVPVPKDRCLKPGSNLSNANGNKFKIDNRTGFQGLEIDANFTKYGYEKHCDIKGSLAHAKTNFTSKISTVKNSGKDLRLETAKRSNSDEMGISKQGFKEKGSDASSIRNMNCSDTKRLSTVPVKGNSHSSNTIDSFGKPVVKINNYAPCSLVNKSVPLLVTEKIIDKMNATTRRYHPHDEKNLNSLHAPKSSNILINPVLLKSLSSNDKIDIVAIASQSFPQKNVSCIVPDNSKMVKQKTKGNPSSVFTDSPSLTSKYKLISKTKLVRRRSRSFSKVRTKACFTKERPTEGRFATYSYPVKRDWSSVTLCRPSPVFPTRYHSSLAKIYPKRRYAVISRTKLIRRLSGSSSVIEDIPKYSVKTKTKLVRKLSESSLKFPRTTDRGKLRNIRPDVERKKNYAVLSKTKLVRRKSNSGILKTMGQREMNKSNVGTIIRRHKLVRNAQIKPGKTQTSKNSDSKPFRRVNTKYKIENRGMGLSAKQKAAKGIISKYRINRLRVESPGIKRTSTRRFTWISSRRKDQLSQPLRRRGSERFSDRIVNIGGILYKATKTSLRKQMAEKKHVLDRVKGSKCIVKLHGNQYHVSAGGRALTRVVSEPLSSSGPSLSRVHIGGLTYSRTKTGHYELTKFHQARAVLSFAKQRSMFTLSQRRKRGTLQKCNQNCIFFNRFGRCTKRDKGECPYLHDPKRIAVCTRFLRGRCPVSNCPFSHEIDPDKMPVCSHFVRSICTRDDCPYRHVRVNPNAPLCLDFLHGHCPLGQECKKQHVLECEEFNTSGKCPRGEACPLSHRKKSRKKRKSVSLEPATYSARQRTTASLSRRRKSSDTLDVLGGPKIKRREKRHIVKSYNNVHKRYFQVSNESNVVAEDTAEREATCLKEAKVSNSPSEVPNKIESNPTVNASTRADLSCSSSKEGKRSLEDELNEGRSPGSLEDIEQKRERVLQKVEKVKQTYDAAVKGVATTEENNGIVDVNRDGGEFDGESETNANDEITSKSSDFRCDAFERRPLPRRMPSYISLTKESGDVEDQ